MSEPYGRTDMYACGCTVNTDGYIDIECASHRNEGLPVVPNPDYPALDDEPWVTPDAARETGRQRAAELFTNSDDENWLGI